MLVVRWTCVFLLFFANLVFAQEVDERKIQSAFLYQFTNYLEWSEDSFGSEFQVWVQGDDAIFDSISASLSGKSIKGKSVSIKKGLPAKTDKPQIVILIGSDLNTVESAVRKLSGISCLIVAAADGAAQKGVGINFFHENDRIRFEINRKSLSERKVQAGAQLLKLARLVD